MITDDFSRPILLAPRRMYSIESEATHVVVLYQVLRTHNSAFPCRPPPLQHFFPLLPSVLFTDQCPIFPLSSTAKKGGRAELPSAEARHRLRRGLLLLLLLLLPYRPPLSCTKSMTLLLLLPKAKHRQRREGPAFSKFLGLASQQKVFRAPLLLTPLCPCMSVLYVRTTGLLSPPSFPLFLTAKTLLSFGAFLFFPYRL